MPDLWLARHAIPLVPPGTCYGRSDLAADPDATGRAAQGLAQALPADLHIITSPLQRCEHLALILQALRPDLTCETEPRIAEMDFGAWEGQPWAELPPAELAAWTDDFADYRTGATGESVRGFMLRVEAALEHWQAHQRVTGRCLLWVTHAGVERAVRLLQQGIPCPAQAREWPRQGLDFGAWTRLAAR